MVSKFKPQLELARRSVGLALENPAGLRTPARMLYRNMIGIPKDRNNPEGWSGPPAKLDIYLTRRCNLKCLMCGQHRHSEGPPPELTYFDPSRELPLERWVGLLDEVKPFLPQIYITGGEPTLYSHCLDVIRAAKERKFVVHLQTNGTRLSGMAEELVDCGVDVVTVSMDGPTARYHDKVRGVKGAFDTSSQGVRDLVRARGDRGRPGPLLMINCVISKANLDVLDRMVTLGLDLGVDLVQIQHTIFDTAENVARHNRVFCEEFTKKRGLDVVHPSIPEGEYYESEFDRSDIPRLEAMLQKAKKMAAGRIQFIEFPRLGGGLMDPYYFDLNYPFGQVCNRPWAFARILPDGTIAQCLHVMAGNIAEKPFMEIWNGRPMRNFRKLIAERLLPGCTRCCSRKMSV